MTDLHRLAACESCGRQFDTHASPSLASLAPGDSFLCSCGQEVTVPTGRPHDAAVAACSACGAPRQGREEACRYCESAFTLRELDLDAICPGCFARVSRRGRFCHHCALPLTAPRDGAPVAHRCPVCPEEDGERRPLVSRSLGDGDKIPLFECSTCAGLWLDRQVFTLLVERVKTRRAALAGPVSGSSGKGGEGGRGLERVAGGASSGRATPEGGERRNHVAPGGWAYRPCIVCGNLMNRRNYASKSGVILDVCKEHGLWFDADELHRVLEWVRQGGATDADVRAAEAVRRTRDGGGPSLAGGLGGGSWSGGDRTSGRWLAWLDVVAVVGSLTEAFLDFRR